MWNIHIISLDTLDIITNSIDNHLIEFIIMNRQTISAITVGDGIRATQFSFAGALEVNINNLDIMALLNINFENQSVSILELIHPHNTITENLPDIDDDFNSSYISDEDFNFGRYEWTNTDFEFDDTDWQYNSS